jgi:hypothetical protein
MADIHLTFTEIIPENKQNNIGSLPFHLETLKEVQGPFIKRQFLDFFSLSFTQIAEILSSFPAVIREEIHHRNVFHLSSEIVQSIGSKLTRFIISQ